MPSNLPFLVNYVNLSLVSASVNLTRSILNYELCRRIPCFFFFFLFFLGAFEVRFGYGLALALL